ncbi:MAG: M20/M25/M40 family metallo-hydrolase [Ignavibacteriae bacterium]|nr:M20/M25/M40 family metallo-hydrolase [Ignavibacteriota bacterium]
MNNNKRLSLLLFLILNFSFCIYSQEKVARPYDSLALNIHKTGLASGKAYELLYELSTTIGHRLSGSENAAKAVAWAKRKMESLGFDSVYLEPVMVPHWVRGDVEQAYVLGSSFGSNGKQHENVELTVCALGGSVATPAEGVTAEVIEVKTFEELQALGEKAKGKIVFFNRPMDKSKLGTFEAYGGAVNQRGSGAVAAASVGGVAAIVRSMTMQLDDVPHTGSMHYVDSLPKVPTAAISTVDANYLSELLKKEQSVRVNLKLSCQTLPDVESANVIGELRGTEFPDEVIVIGGHFDSWDKGQGAHDDGAGCMQSIEALRLLKEMGLKPKRTIRAVLFMNEENGLRGGEEYAKRDLTKDKHLAAMESDAGGFTPKGFGVSTDSVTFEKIARWAYLFEPVDADRIRKGGGGADISALGRKGVVTIGLRPDNHRYFDYHHSDNDTIDKVNERELELGAAAMAVLAYVLAQEGL